MKIHNASENVDTRRTAERYSIVVSTDGNKVSGECGENCDRVESHGTYLSPTSVPAIHSLYFTSIRYQQRLEKIYSKKALGNHESRNNLHIHELDLFLREQVGIIMKSFKSIGCCKKKQEEVKMAKAEIMKGFISYVKCQCAELPRTEIEGALNEDNVAMVSSVSSRIGLIRHSSLSNPSLLMRNVMAKFESDNSSTSPSAHLLSL